MRGLMNIPGIWRLAWQAGVEFSSRGAMNQSCVTIRLLHTSLCRMPSLHIANKGNWFSQRTPNPHPSFKLYFTHIHTSVEAPLCHYLILPQHYLIPLEKHMHTKLCYVTPFSTTYYCYFSTTSILIQHNIILINTSLVLLNNCSSVVLVTLETTLLLF